MEDRSQLINYLIKTYNFKTYLEIGLDDGYNFKRIECESKESVDPYFQDDHSKYDLTFNDDLPYEIKSMLTYRMTSDDFFKQNTKTYDIIFIDGLHTEEQVGRDIINSIKILNDNGLIVVHDCLPKSKEAQMIPRIQCEWNGTVWKAIVELTKQGIDIKIWEGDYGCAIIKKTTDEIKLHYPEESKYIWEEFVKYRDKLINVIDTKTLKDEFKLETL